MSDFKINVQIIFDHNGAKFERSESFTDTQTGNAYAAGIADIDTGGDTAVADADVGTYGWIYVKNLTTSGSAYIDIGHSAEGFAADDAICRLYPGEASIFKTAGLTALYADSSSGTQQLEYAIFQL